MRHLREAGRGEPPDGSPASIMRPGSGIHLVEAGERRALTHGEALGQLILVGDKGRGKIYEAQKTS